SRAGMLDSGAAPLLDAVLPTAPLPLAGGETGAASSSRADLLPPPARIGRYEVHERIGRGGFGDVFRGFDPVLKRAVAVKTCLVAEPAVRQRFVREAELAARLVHPTIVTVHDFGADGEVPYLVQELLPGEDLAQ